jgi:hypothetical protein
MKLAIRSLQLLSLRSYDSLKEFSLEFVPNTKGM